MTIAIVGLGYVGLSLACLLSKDNNIISVDIDRRKVGLIDRGISPIADTKIEAYLKSEAARLHVTSDALAAYKIADYVVIATPTDYDEGTHRFDTSSIDDVLATVESCSPKAMVIIKSTIPVGYAEAASHRHPGLSIIFSPEFLREGHALEDNLNPSRIIVGVAKEKDRAAADCFAHLLLESSETKTAPVMVMGSSEAEAVKLFANTYLALRVSFFNELDTYAESRSLSTQQIIQGVCLDPRIGDGYNNPSFGYGGYCLPKDSKQLLSNYHDVPQNLIQAIVSSNETRKRFVAKQVLARHPKVVGVYRLAMKAGSDNIRQSASIDVLELLKKLGVGVLIYEPSIKDTRAFDCEVVNDLTAFAAQSDVIIANRWEDVLTPFEQKVYCRDLWRRD